ncbi:MAG: ATP-binding protein [Anaerolineae bacterium]
MERSLEPPRVLGRSDVDLEDLRRPVLTGLCLVGLAVAWLWTAIVATEEGQSPHVQVLLPPLLLLSVCAVGLVPFSRSLRLRSAVLLAGAGLALLLRFTWSGAATWLYYESLLITIAALLAGPRVSFTAAGLLTGGTVLALFTATAPPSPGEVIPPLGLVWATAAVSWLSSRNLYTVLVWALESQARAWRTTDEVRRRREQLKRTLDSLRNAHFALERTTRELEAARMEAEEARQVKGRFVANISHELRTPLNIIVGFAEILCFAPETYGDFPWPPPLREDVVTIWRNAEHLLNMVDDVLDLAQIEASRMPVAPEPTDLCQLIRDTLVSASALLRDSGLEVRVSLPARPLLLDVDRTRIRQVLLNLVNNALRFTEAGYIEVGARVVGDEVEAHVRDSGLGIPADKLDAVFEEFEQADTSIRRRNSGIGLGLTISRHFVRLHGGRMWAASEPGNGSTFFFTLPLPSKHAVAQPLEPRHFGQASQSPEPGPRFAVTLCRDPQVSRILQRHLEGFEVVQTGSLDEAAAAVSDKHPELVFLAAESPETLPQAIGEAQSLARTVSPADLPVIVGTFPTERRAGVLLGVPEFLVKPVTQKEVVAAIRRLCPNPRSILIADDEADMATLLTRMVLAEWPAAEVRTAATGSEALAQAARRPDVLLLDLIMPEMTGIDVIERLRSDDRMAGVPIIVVTARGPAQDLAALSRGEVYIARSGSFAAGELVRLIGAVSRALPPRYANTAAGLTDNREAART